MHACNLTRGRGIRANLLWGHALPIILQERGEACIHQIGECLTSLPNSSTSYLLAAQSFGTSAYSSLSRWNFSGWERRLGQIGLAGCKYVVEFDGVTWSLIVGCGLVERAHSDWAIPRMGEVRWTATLLYFELRGAFLFSSSPLSSYFTFYCAPRRILLFYSLTFLFEWFKSCNQLMTFFYYFLGVDFLEILHTCGFHYRSKVNII